MKETKKRAPEKTSQDKNNNDSIKITLDDLKNCKSPTEFAYLTKTNCCDKLEKIELTIDEFRKIKNGFNSTKSHCNKNEGSNKVYNVCKKCSIVQPDSEKPIEELSCFVCGDKGSCTPYSSTIQDIVISYENFLQGCLYAYGFAFKTQAFDEFLEENTSDDKKAKNEKKDKIRYTWDEDAGPNPYIAKKSVSKPTLMPLAVVPLEHGRWSPKKPKFPIFGLERL